MIRFTVVLALALSTTDAVAQQKPDTLRLRELVVTATRVPLAQHAVSAAVTVLNGDQLRTRGLRTLAEALGTISSAAIVQNGSHGAITSLFLRGGESDYVQVLIDGVRINNPGGQYDLANLTLDNVDRIEVVRGPVSVLYGSDAVSGVVQIFTKRGGAARSMIRAETGTGSKLGPQAGDDSYRATRYETETAGQLGRASWSLGGSHFKTDGLYAFNNGYRNSGLSGALLLPLGGNWAASWTGRYTDSEFHYPTDGSGRLVDRNALRDSRALTSGLQASGKPLAQLQVQLELGHNDYDERYTDLVDGPGDTLGTFTARSHGHVQRSAAELIAHYTLRPDLVLSLGGELERQSDRNTYESDGQFGPFDSKLGRTRNNRGAFLQVLHAADRYTLNGGLRIDANDRFGTFSTYRVGGSVRVVPALRLRAAAGTSFKEPTFFENYAEGFTRGNPELEPEHSRSFEVGGELALLDGRLALEATRFHQRFRDLIQYVPRDFGATEPNYSNLAGARANGTEVELRGLLGRLRLSGGVTVLETQVTDAGNGSDPSFEQGKQLLRRPKLRANAGADFTATRFGLFAQVSHVGKRDDLDFSRFPSPRVKLSRYTLLDLGGQLAIGDFGGRPIAVTGKLVNAFDQRYEEILNFTARGRSFHLGVQLGAR